MSNNIVFGIEMLLVFGAVLAFAVWELVKLNREKKKDAEKERED